MAVDANIAPALRVAEILAEHEDALRACPRLAEFLVSLLQGGQVPHTHVRNLEAYWLRDGRVSVRKTNDPKAGWRPHEVLFTDLGLLRIQSFLLPRIVTPFEPFAPILAHGGSLTELGTRLLPTMASFAGYPLQARGPSNLTRLNEYLTCYEETVQWARRLIPGNRGRDDTDVLLALLDPTNPDPGHVRLLLDRTMAWAEPQVWSWSPGMYDGRCCVCRVIPRESVRAAYEDVDGPPTPVYVIYLQHPQMFNPIEPPTRLRELKYKIYIPTAKGRESHDDLPR